MRGLLLFVGLMFMMVFMVSPIHAGVGMITTSSEIKKEVTVDVVSKNQIVVDNGIQIDHGVLFPQKNRDRYAKVTAIETTNLIGCTIIANTLLQRHRIDSKIPIKVIV